MKVSNNKIISVRNVIREIHLVDLVIFVLFNAICGIISGLTLTYFYRETYPFFLEQWPRYAVAYLVLSGTVVSFYVWRMAPSYGRASWRDILYITSCSFFFSLLLSSFIFHWRNLQSLQSGAIFLFDFMASSGWIMLLLFYFKTKIINPRMKAMLVQVQESQAQRDRAEAELHLLKAQIEPHFFYNTLANLHSLIDYDHDRAKLLLEHLTEFLRLCIPQFREQWNKVSSELLLVEKYLAIQNIRFDGAIIFNQKIDDQLREQKILPLSILTLVENAVKHGLEKKLGGSLTVEVYLKEERLCIAVIDDAAQSFNEGDGVGIDNLKSRLNLVYQGKATFKLYQLAGIETRAQIEVPIND